MSNVSLITDAVKSKYGAVAVSGLSSDRDDVRSVAQAFGYTAEELTSIPAEANMGLSCGNPTAFASLREGETVVDLGSGGGLDVLLAARKVGPAGKAIGIDMTAEMIGLANRNAAKAGLTNTEFHLASIDQMPIPDSTVDCVISNCVINLAPDKAAVLNEIARVLKPGGRLAISDIALKQDLPQELADDISAYVGCIAGAIHVDEYRRLLNEAGFSSIQVVDSGADLNAYSQVEGQAACCAPSASPTACCSPAPAGSDACCTPNPKPKTSLGLDIIDSSCCSTAPSDQEPDFHGRLSNLLKQYNVNDYAASVRVFALKPAH